MGRQKSGQNRQSAWKEETMNWKKQRNTGVGNQDIQRNPRAKKETEIRVCRHRTSPRRELFNMLSHLSCPVKPPCVRCLHTEPVAKPGQQIHSKDGSQRSPPNRADPGNTMETELIMALLMQGSPRHHFH